MPIRKKRVRISFLVLRTQRLLLLFLGGLAILFASIYLFLMNRLAMQGYVLTVETEKHLRLAEDIEKVEAQIARYETREYVSESTKTKIMVQREKKRFVFIKPNYTAKK
ncbi:hypothetical protein QUF70_19980 [Desulfobacterales bacterium HSG17]|nr:hypothetical protein [Desulfobacterales bacterium HSG17]